MKIKKYFFILIIILVSLTGLYTLIISFDKNKPDLSSLKYDFIEIRSDSCNIYNLRTNDNVFIDSLLEFISKSCVPNISGGQFSKTEVKSTFYFKLFKQEKQVLNINIKLDKDSNYYISINKSNTSSLFRSPTYVIENYIYAINFERFLIRNICIFQLDNTKSR